MMQKSRLVFIIHALNVGGAERIIATLLNHVDRDRYEVHLILFQAIGAFMDEIKDDVTIHNLNAPSVKRGIFALVKKLHYLKPDTVFSGIGFINSLLSAFIPTINRLSNKKIHWVARETNIVSILNNKERFSTINNWLYRHTYKNYDVIVCQSNVMRQDLLEQYQIPLEKMVIINNPVDMEKVQKGSLEQLSRPFLKEKVNILAVGAIRTQKRFDLLLQAFTLLEPNRYSLTIVGTGVEESKIKALAHKLDIASSVYFEGFQTNPYKYMQHADVMVLSSEYEGFPNVLLEANSCGLPIIAFDCKGGTTEIIKKGFNGQLVPCKNILKLAQKIEQFNAKDFDAIGIKEHIKNNYHLDIILKQYNEVLL